MRTLPAHIRGFRFCATVLSLGLCASFLAPCLPGQQTGKLRPEEDLQFRQQMELGSSGEALAPQSVPLQPRRTLNFTVSDLKANTVLSADDARAQRQKMLARLNAAHQAIMTCVLKDDGTPAGSNEEILERLQHARAQAQGDLRRDFDNLLISALSHVNVDFPKEDGTLKTADFRLWSYRILGETNPRTRRLCGPTIIAEPGSVLFIPVLNLLDKKDLAIGNLPWSDEIVFRAKPNTPHGFDVVNLHTHGLNVSPVWPADDVFREIHPYQLKFFVYQIPEDHPTGTFWYHPHKHGAAASHVAGGMAGPLLVKGKEPRGLDACGAAEGWQEVDEPLILQQLTAYQEKTQVDQNPSLFVFRPDFYAVKPIRNIAQGGGLPNFGKLVTWMDANLTAVAPKDNWISTWISGRLAPALPARATGKTYRMRLIHAGVEENWTFGIARDGGDNGNGQAIPRIQVIAWDGLPMPSPYELSADHPLTLSPGNRVDVLVWFPEEAHGNYWVVNQKTGGTPDAGLKLAKFEVQREGNEPPQFLDDAKIKPFLKAEPAVASVKSAALFEVGEGSSMRVQAGNPVTFNPGTFTINNEPFPGSPKYFALGSAARVMIKAPFHPIHIHVNPMLMEPKEERKAAGLPTGKYWTDTVLGGFTDDVGLMPFDHWTGRLVVHCHILNHEDNGMMNVMEIRNGIGFPIPPLPVLLDMPSIPAYAREHMKPEWPRDATLPQSDNGKVIVYLFLPRAPTQSQCVHCTVAANSIAALRSTPGVPDFRVIAVTGPNVTQLPQLAAALQLDESKDVLCADANLDIFQALAIIDGTPIYKPEEKRYVFPASFDAAGKIKHQSDVMHGLFIAAPDGFIVSSTRGFVAHDDIVQILAEIRLAADVPRGMQLVKERLDKIAPVGAEPSTLKEFRDVHLKRFDTRLEEFRTQGEQK